jgi:hypothetical protein
VKGSARGAIDNLEEAVHLLRRAPVHVHLLWAAGALPYGLCIVWFTAEMSWSSFAAERLVEASLGLALLFAWKQIWEAVFCASVQSMLTGSVEPWSRGRVLRLAAVQLAIQPWSLLAIPIAALLTVPFATTIAFFRNVSVYAGSGSVHAVRLAREQCVVETKQNWMLQALLGLLTLLLILNYAITLLILPQLGRSIFGLETTASRYPMWLLTSTGVTAVLVLVYLTLEPLLSTLYVLRCFYGQSIHTGADLRSSLRRILAGQRAAAATLVLAIVLLFLPATASGQSSPSRTSESAALRPADLERSVSTVVRRSEFAWRIPRTDADAKDRPKWASWLDGVFERAGEFWDWLIEGLRRMFTSDPQTSAPGDANDVWTRTLKYSLWVLGAVFAVGAALILYKQRDAARRRANETAAAAGAPSESLNLDLNDEALTADKLPEESWLDLAQEWIAKGDMRLALRAMHLAGLSYLNGKGLVTVQRWKTGLEYCTELERRSRSIPAVTPVFVRNVRVFEASWYGRHEVNQDSLQEFARGLEQMRSHASNRA